MKNYDVIAAPEDVPNKAYVDNMVFVGTAQPAGSEIWIDTDEPDPTEVLQERMAVLEARIAALEGMIGS
jgi:hypothetical protein